MSIIARLPRIAVRYGPASSCRYYSQEYSNKLPKFIKISPEIKDALEQKAPIVALESANLSHPNVTNGLPYPHNIEYAVRAEQIIRQTGAIPATISVVEGFVRVGTMLSLFHDLGSSKEALKVSRRDLPYILGMHRKSGGCTIAAAMAIAEMVGIKVLATGGIGGVHRAATLMMDISADVGELGRTNVAVVCSGPRPYLDVEGTIEFLETRGVPVATFKSASTGDSMDDPLENPMGDPIDMRYAFGAREMTETMVPAFYSHSGRIKSPLVIESAEEAAKIIHASHELGLAPGQLFCNPIPLESEVNIQVIENVVRRVFKLARKKNKRNKEDIENIVFETRRSARGEAIIAEKALLLNNAKMGAQVAIELSKLEGGPGRVDTPIPEAPKMAVRRPPSKKWDSDGKGSSSSDRGSGKRGSKREQLKRKSDSKFYLRGKG